jgi:alkyl sulfatase BDS1-like metallo-beta-lactamase superfamily hydrolase
MATKTRKPLTKAFIDIGKVPILGPDGKTTHLIQEYVIVGEDAAKYMGAKYTTVSPPPRKITTKSGKTYTREVAVGVTGVPHKLGFVEGTTGTGKARKIKIKWVTIHIPKGAKLRTYIAAFRILVKKKPSLLKMPSGKSTRLFDTK